MMEGMMKRGSLEKRWKENSKKRDPDKRFLHCKHRGLKNVVCGLVDDTLNCSTCTCRVLESKRHLQST